MGIFKSHDDYQNAQQSSQNAVNALSQAYDQESQILSPYTQNAGTDFDTARTGLYGAMNNMQQQGNPNTPFYKMLQTTPQQQLAQAQSGYQTSPYEQQMEQFGDAVLTNKLNASGYEGSGIGDMEHEELETNMQGQFDQQYLKNLSSVFDRDLKVLGIDDKQRQGIMNSFGKLIGLESKQSRNLADMSQKTGLEQANVYKNQARMDEQEARTDANFQPIAQLANIVGTGITGYNLFGSKGGKK